MCEVLIFNTQKRYENHKNFGNFSAPIWKFSNFSATFFKKIATFWQLLDTFIGNFFGIHRQLVVKPSLRASGPQGRRAAGPLQVVRSGSMGRWAAGEEGRKRLEPAGFLLTGRKK